MVNVFGPLLQDQWCGPCCANIESSLASRLELKDHPNLDFIFITDESGTPDLDFFEKYSTENALKNSYRVTADEYLALRELFKFNSIPRYVLVDETGKIADDDFRIYNFKRELRMCYPDRFENLM